MPQDKHRAETEADASKTQASETQTSKSQTSKPQTSKTHASGTFTPFADDSGVRTIGALSFENGTDRIALHGSLDLTRDKSGLAQARLLRQTLDAIVTALEGEDLPEAVAEAPVEAPKSVPNPFA